MWPGNLKSIELVGDMNFTELWMLKERIDCGNAVIIDGPEKVFGKNGKYYTIYATGDQAYTVLTDGIHGGGQSISDDWCCVTRINKISVARVQEIRSWKYCD
jgi:hypothetical protein